MIATQDEMRDLAARNSAFAAYLDIYEQITCEFKTRVTSFGLPFSDTPTDRNRDAVITALENKGVCASNDSKSIHVGWISPSCIQCRKGLNTVTFLLSVQCPKHCFFCFNPNQIDYDRLLVETNDICSELDDLHNRGTQLTDIALTGGEPLLHKQEMFSFFEHAHNLYPNARFRLYTSGFSLDSTTLKRLKSAGLNEIRFSVKMEESSAEHAALFDLMELAKTSIENVMVEMPVMPDDRENMQSLLVELNARGIDGINLLELCYPLHNAEAFAKRGYTIKNTPYRVLYDYWYAGGLPIAGSEEACLDLVDFAVEQGLELGVHYCSLENKFSGQIYQQNTPYQTSFPTHIMSERDYFLKTAHAFGDDVARVICELDDRGLTDYLVNDEDGCMSFTPSYLSILAETLPNIPIGIGLCVVETDADGTRLRELKVNATTPHTFDIATDI